MAADDRTSRTPPPSFAPGCAGTPGAPGGRGADRRRTPVAARRRRPRPRVRRGRRASRRLRPTLTPDGVRPPTDDRSRRTVRTAPRELRHPSRSPAAPVGGRAPAARAGRRTPVDDLAARDQPPGRSRAGPPAARPPAGPAARAAHAPQHRPPRPARVAATASSLVGAVAVLVLVALLAWPIGLAVWANGKVQHTAALSGAANTPGTTYLLTGSDSRADGGIGQDGTEGSRTDTILLLHVPTAAPRRSSRSPGTRTSRSPGTVRPSSTPRSRGARRRCSCRRSRGSPGSPSTTTPRSGWPGSSRSSTRSAA